MTIPGARALALKSAAHEVLDLTVKPKLPVVKEPAPASQPVVSETSDGPSTKIDV
ncbi:hypothetical protein ACFSM5_22135 [Lacibacterium aquatile]|uniref:Uncharacterized protein n=1 Tax=Lacibacterium aquatile TaxID=1168082 RepID=A0ABW5E330_9PROT